MNALLIFFLAGCGGSFYFEDEEYKEFAVFVTVKGLLGRTGA